MVRALEEALRKYVLPIIREAMREGEGLEAVETLAESLPPYREKGISWLEEIVDNLRPEAYRMIMEEARNELSPVGRMVELYYAWKGGFTQTPPPRLPRELLAEGEERRKAEERFFECTRMTHAIGKTRFEIWAFGLYAGFTPEEIDKMIREKNKERIKENIPYNKRKIEEEIGIEIGMNVAYGYVPVITEETITRIVWDKESLQSMVKGGYITPVNIEEWIQFEEELQKKFDPWKKLRDRTRS